MISKFDKVTKVAARKVGKVKTYSNWHKVIKRTTKPFQYISPMGHDTLSAEYFQDCIKFKKEVVLVALNDILKRRNRQNTLKIFSEKVMKIRD